MNDNGLDSLIGPVICHDCHAPALYRTAEGWRERIWKRKGKEMFPVLRPHRCTATRPLLDLCQR